MPAPQGGQAAHQGIVFVGRIGCQVLLASRFGPVQGSLELAPTLPRAGHAQRQLWCKVADLCPPGESAQIRERRRPDGVARRASGKLVQKLLRNRPMEIPNLTASGLFRDESGDAGKPDKQPLAETCRAD